MALSGARNIEIGGIRYKWKGPGGHSRFRGWSPRDFRLVVQAPNGAMLVTTLWSKRWLPEHNYDEDNAREHKAAFSPGDVRTCIEAAIKAGWSPQSRQKTFVLDPAPDCKDYGPHGAPRDESHRRYGPCYHGVRGYCWECAAYARETEELLTRARAEGYNHIQPEQECCLVCFKQGRVYAAEIRSGQMPTRFHQSPWRVVRYRVDGPFGEREDYGVVCSAEHEERFYELCRQGIPTLYDHIFENLENGAFDDDYEQNPG